MFDYAEEKDGKYDITLILYANAGVFAESLEDDMVSFAGDFEDASVVSITRTGDATAELKLSVPSERRIRGRNEPERDGEAGGRRAGQPLGRSHGAGNILYAGNTARRVWAACSPKMEVGQIKDIVGGFGNTTWGLHRRCGFRRIQRHFRRIQRVGNARCD